jgi:hypothetical protein
MRGTEDGKGALLGDPYWKAYLYSYNMLNGMTRKWAFRFGYVELIGRLRIRQTIIAELMMTTQRPALLSFLSQ